MPIENNFRLLLNSQRGLHQNYLFINVLLSIAYLAIDYIVS